MAMVKSQYGHRRRQYGKCRYSPRRATSSPVSGSTSMTRPLYGLAPLRARPDQMVRVSVEGRSEWRRFSASRCFVELDGIAIGILDLDLLAAGTDLDLVPESGSCLPERRHRGPQAFDIQHDPVPATGLLAAPVGHRPRSGAFRPTQKEVKVAATHGCDRSSLVRKPEPEVL